MTKMIKPVKEKKAKSKKAPKNTRILFVLDRSGSMQCIARDTVGSFNTFVSEQKKVPGKATLSLKLFDDRFEDVHVEVPLDEVPELTLEKFAPRGWTALLDAVGQMISKHINDNPKDTKTILAILTDGEENRSSEYTNTSVKALIERVQQEHDWSVMFLGANINAGIVAGNMGISAKDAVTFDYHAAGAKSAMDTVCLASSSMRGFTGASAIGDAYSMGNASLEDVYKTAMQNNADKQP